MYGILQHIDILFQQKVTCSTHDIATYLYFISLQSSIYNIVKVVIYTGGPVRVFYGQTLHMGIKYVDVLFTGTTLKLIFLPY